MPLQEPGFVDYSPKMQNHPSWPSRVTDIPTRLLRPWDFPGRSPGVGCHFLLQGIFLTQGLNPGLPHCRQTLYCLSHQGSRSERAQVITAKFVNFHKYTGEASTQTEHQIITSTQRPPRALLRGVHVQPGKELESSRPGPSSSGARCPGIEMPHILANAYPRICIGVSASTSVLPMNTQD